MTSDTYYSNGNEVQLFERAYHQRLPVMLTGPTGCGKTRLVEHMGLLLRRAVVTIAGQRTIPAAKDVGQDGQPHAAFGVDAAVKGGLRTPGAP